MHWLGYAYIFCWTDAWLFTCPGSFIYLYWWNWCYCWPTCKKGSTKARYFSSTPVPTWWGVSISFLYLSCHIHDVVLWYFHGSPAYGRLTFKQANVIFLFLYFSYGLTFFQFNGLTLACIVHWMRRILD